MSIKEVAITIDSNDNGMRIWKIALEHWKAIVQSREQMRRCFKRGEITLNGKVAQETQCVSTGDKLALRFNKYAAHESIYGREKLTVLFEDDELAIVLKPSGKTMMQFGCMLPYSLKPSLIAAKEQRENSEESEHVDMDHKDDEILGPLLEAAPTEEESETNEDGLEREMDNNHGYDQSASMGSNLGQKLVPCALHGIEKASNGLVLVAKTYAMKQKLAQLHKSGGIRRSFRILCHGGFKRPIDDSSQLSTKNPGYYQPQDTIPISHQLQEASGIQQLCVVQLTPSNVTGFITTLDADVLSPTMGIHLRRYFMSIQHPVIGNSSNTRPLKANRDKGLCAALISVEFRHPSTGVLVKSVIEEPKKFKALRDREERAFIQRKQQDDEELLRGGLGLAENYSRKSEKPIAYLVGEKDFFNMRFKTTPAALIPRTSTETLVKATLAFSKDRTRLPSVQTSAKVLDVGTGSGCLLLAILKNIDKATGMGIDISLDALEVANTNRELLGMTDRAVFAIGDFGKLEKIPGIYQQFDFLVCNPPYLDGSKSARITKSFESTRYEPPIALFAEQGGYGAYELLAGSLKRDVELLLAQDDKNSSATIMAPHGHIVLEIGSGMGPRVREIFSFLRFVKALEDQQGTERCLVFAMPILKSSE